jgi:hypothetical protein
LILTSYGASASSLKLQRWSAVTHVINGTMLPVWELNLLTSNWL